jgi:branched-subunit amino acid aminotransferase/4-amino-4-deoxychorismate lyase
VGITNKAFLHPQPYSFAKTLNALPYVLAAKDAQQHGWNEALLCSSNGILVEGTFSNLVLVFGNEIKTPAHETGAVQGTGLRALEECLQAMGKKLEYTFIPSEALTEATEIWFVNAANGIHAVEKYANQLYRNEWSKEVGKFMEKHFLSNH